MRRYWSCAGPRPPEGTYQGMVQNTGKVGVPCFACPAPWAGEDERENEDVEHGEGS